MVNKHLSAGDPVPQFTGKPRVYVMRFCPYAQRVILILGAKKVDYDITYIDLDSKPEWLIGKSPLGKVPALEVMDGVCVYDSAIIADYLDEKYPDILLKSDKPLDRAQDKLIVENFGGVSTGFYVSIIQPDKITDEIVNNYIKGFTLIESELKKRATKYLFGNDRPGIIDLMVYPWFERKDCVATMRGQIFEIGQQKFPLIHKWYNEMQKLEYIKLYHVDTEDHVIFLNTKINGNSDYDMLFN